MQQQQQFYLSQPFAPAIPATTVAVAPRCLCFVHFKGNKTFNACIQLMVLLDY